MLVPDSDLHKQAVVSALSWFFSVSVLLQIPEWPDYNQYLKNKARLSKINHVFFLKKGFILSVNLLFLKKSPAKI